MQPEVVDCIQYKNQKMSKSKQRPHKSKSSSKRDKKKQDEHESIPEVSERSSRKAKTDALETFRLIKEFHIKPKRAHRSSKKRKEHQPPDSSYDQEYENNNFKINFVPEIISERSSVVGKH